MYDAEANEYSPNTQEGQTWDDYIARGLVTDEPYVVDRETNGVISGKPPESGHWDYWPAFAAARGYPVDRGQMTPEMYADYKATYGHITTSSGLDGFLQSMMQTPIGIVVGGGLMNALGLGAGAASGALSSADLAGLAQMAADAGLTGPAAQAFVNAGGMASLAPLAGMQGAPSWLADAGGGASAGLDLGKGAGGPGDLSSPSGNFDPTYNPGGWDDVLPPGGPTGLPTPSYLQQLKDAGVPWERIQQLSNVSGGASLLQRLASGNASGADYLELAGKLGSTALGVMGANSQADALSGNADKYLALGSGYRDRLNASYQPGFTMASDPGYTDALKNSSDAVMRSLSVNGNPYGNPGALMEATKKINSAFAYPALQNYRSQLGTFGQLGVNTAGASDTAAASNSGGLYDALGYGLSQFTQPQSPLNDILKQIQGQYRTNTGNVPV